MNEMIFHTITAIERQLAELRELIVNTSQELEHIESMKKVDEILFQTCSDLMDVSETQIKSRTRKRAVVDARAICIAFTYFAEYNKTLKCIGDSFGIDHATVIHSVKKCCNLYTTDAQFKFLVNDFFIVFEKNGYNCTTTKQRLTDGYEYFDLRGSLTKRESEPVGKSIDQQTDKVIFHTA